jgi:3-methylcrotonyl-CoA carboxylase alpha subunit
VKLAFRDGDRVREVEVTLVAPGRYRVSMDGAASEIEAAALGDGRFRLGAAGIETLAEVTREGAARFVRLGGLDFVLERLEVGATAPSRRRERAAGGGLEAPMPGVVTRVLVQDGETVAKGQPLLALEAMKMEHVIRAPAAGRVKRVNARAGEMVNGGVALVEMEATG